MASIIEHDTTWKISDREIAVLSEAGEIYRCPTDHSALDATGDELPVWHVKNPLSVTEITELLTIVREGCRCINCLTTAQECQHIFMDHDERRWCCPACREHGPRAMHKKLASDNTSFFLQP